MGSQMAVLNLTFGDLESQVKVTHIFHGRRSVWYTHICQQYITIVM